MTLKLAVSLDGCIALADGTSQWITGEAARSHVHAQRANHDAILVGGGTWRADRPKLNVRLPGIEGRSPDRVLLTRGVAPDDVRVINRPEQITDLDGVQYLYVEGGAETAAATAFSPASPCAPSSGSGRFSGGGGVGSGVLTSKAAMTSRLTLCAMSGTKACASQYSTPR